LIGVKVWIFKGEIIGKGEEAEAETPQKKAS
jgi:ribosomal protein S3